MSSSEFIYLLLLFPAGILAGIMNVVAGGGSFLTLPLLIATGLPVDIANGTNRISVVAQGLFATVDFKKSGTFDADLYKNFLPWLAFGALIGAYAATKIDPDQLKRVFGVLFLVIGIYLLIRTRFRPRADAKQLRSAQESSAARRLQDVPRLVRYVSLLLVGIYGGFIQAGVGLWILLVGSALFKLDTVRVNAVKLPLTLTFTAPALLLFLRADMVRWQPGLILAAGTVLGARWGVRLSIKGGQPLIIRVMIGLLVVSGLHLLFIH